MRVAIGLAFVVTAAVVACAGVCFDGTSAFAQRPAIQGAERGVASDQLIALSCETAEGRQQITLVDPKARVMSVYHIDRSTGEITLKSVRNVHWDLLMEEFNGTSPSPRDIRALLDQR